MRTNRRRSSATCFLALFGLCLVACEQTEIIKPEQGLTPPAITLSQRGPQTIELSIAGPDGLRALQANLRYDPATLKITKIAAGKEASRLDRIFFGDLGAAKGQLVIGLADTRKVRLPARGSLLLITVEALAGAKTGKVTLDGIVGVRQPTTRLTFPARSLELTL